ncbi:MAG: glycosyltransferase [Bacillota bacterium]|nr:glycosyltransferase [Bacillota bacterium]
MKNICFFGNFSGGGTEKVTSLIANEITKQKSKYKIYILKKNYPNRSLKFYFSENIAIFTLFKENDRNSIIMGIASLRKFLKTNNIDVLINVEAMMGIYSIIATSFMKCKNIIWEHANYFQNQNSRYIKLIRKLELYISDYYIVLTKRDLNNFKKHYTIKCPITNIYNPVEKVCHKIDYQSNSKIIISVGHIRFIKNFIIIPDIAKIVLKKHPMWTWKIYGVRGDKSYEILYKKIIDYGLQKNVILCGSRSSMDEIYPNASILVLTSLMEGCPMTLLEAKYYKIPCISFDIETGPDEIINDKINGFLVEPYSIEKMADKICILIENDNLRKQMSEMAYYNIKDFDINDIKEKWMYILDYL